MRLRVVEPGERECVGVGVRVVIGEFGRDRPDRAAPGAVALLLQADESQSADRTSWA